MKKWIGIILMLTAIVIFLTNIRSKKHSEQKAPLHYPNISIEILIDSLDVFL